MKWSFIVLGAVFVAAIAGGIAALCRKRPEKSNDDIDGVLWYTTALSEDGWTKGSDDEGFVFFMTIRFVRAE